MLVPTGNSSGLWAELLLLPNLLVRPSREHNQSSLTCTYNYDTTYILTFVGSTVFQARVYAILLLLSLSLFLPGDLDTTAKMHHIMHATMNSLQDHLDVVTCILLE